MLFILLTADVYDIYRCFTFFMKSFIKDVWRIVCWDNITSCQNVDMRLDTKTQKISHHIWEKKSTVLVIHFYWEIYSQI